jgi:asparagine synthase (glutamine-hydrolysing)
LRGLDRDFATGAEDLTFVAPAWRAEMARQAGKAGWDVMPPKSSKDRRWKLLQTFDPGNYRKRSLARWGIEERDATADRRLVEFCFSLPAEAFLKDGVRRPAMRHALAGRLPAAIMSQKLRGYQMADWYEHLSAGEVQDFVRRLADQGEDAVVDLDALRAAAESWPTGNWHHRPTIYFYRTKFLRALSAAHFIRSARGLPTS